jgi:hypothetical protein
MKTMIVGASYNTFTRNREAWWPAYVIVWKIDLNPNNGSL